MTTDNTQAELRKLDSFRAINSLMVDAKIKVGHREQHIDYLIQEVLDWHNRQKLELLERIVRQVQDPNNVEFYDEVANKVLSFDEFIEAERNRLKNT